MSTRVWLSSQGFVALNHLRKEVGQYTNLTIKTHDASGRRYARLTGNLADPAEEVPEIPQQYVELVTFKGTVRVLGLKADEVRSGLYLSADLRTTLVVGSVCEKNEYSLNKMVSCEVSARGPSVVAVRELLYRLSFSTHQDWRYSLITKHEWFLLDKESSRGSFAPILLPFDH